MGEFIGVIQSIEDDSYQGKAHKKVTLKDGNVLKVKYGQEGFLKAKWGDLEIGRAYTWKMGDFQGKPFVQDFKMVELPEQSPEGVAQTPKPSSQVIAEGDKPPVRVADTKNRSYALSYAKDLAVARIRSDPTAKVDPVTIMNVAYLFDDFLNGVEVKKKED